MDRLHEIEVFISVAELGSFAKAAQKLRLSPPAVTRAIVALEDRLQAKVFHRTTRSLNITEVGQRFLISARTILSDLEMAEKNAVGEMGTATGHLTITASVTFGRVALAPLVHDFLLQHPKVTVSLLLFDRVVHLTEEGIDLAVRIGPLPDSDLVAKRAGDVRRVLVASPDYLVQCGTPINPSDLKKHKIIAFTALMPKSEWRYWDGKKNHIVALTPRFEMNDAMAAIESASRGEGITAALSYMVADLVRAGQLVPILETFAPPELPVHLVYPSNRLIAPKLRAFVDYAAPRLKERLEEMGFAQPNG